LTNRYNINFLHDLLVIKETKWIKYALLYLHATQLAELDRASTNFPKLYVLFYQEGSTTVLEFEQLTASAYPNAFIDMNTFFDLIGNSPPRIYHLKAGKVEAIWDEDFVSHYQETFELN
jgi:hypothetical protein